MAQNTTIGMMRGDLNISPHIIPTMHGDLNISPIILVPHDIDTGSLYLANPVTIEFGRSFVMGAIAGSIGAIVSHPVDTYKSIVQTCTKNATTPPKWFKIHVRQYYNGLPASIASIVLEKAIVMGVYTNTKKATNSDFISGGVAGFFSSFPVALCERLKILKQISVTHIHNDVNTPAITHPSITVLQRYKFRECFSGLSATFTREVPGFAIYFSVYNWLKNNRNDLPIHHNFFNGALSGTAAWLFIYPQDSIKTIIQGSKDKKLSYIDTGKQIHKVGGFKNFYRGFPLCVARACLLHGTVLASMEYLNKLFI
jgi:hypothetical protein